MDLFNTKEASQRLMSLEEAIHTMQAELRAQRMLALATAVLELLVSRQDAQAVRVAITEQTSDQMFPGPGAHRTLHCKVSLLPAGHAVELPCSVVPALVVGEGDFEAKREDPNVQELLDLYNNQPEVAVFKMSQLMDPCFLPVMHSAETNIVT